MFANKHGTSSWKRVIEIWLIICALFKTHVKKKEVWFLPLMQVANIFIDLFNYKGMHETNENFKGDHDNW